YIKGLVIKINLAGDEAGVRFGKFKAVVTAKDMGRSQKKPKDELKPGMLAEFFVKQVDVDNQMLQVELSQVPEVQAAIVTINAKTGEIAAMVGGYDYHTNKFNNATQGLRQTGSAYKPFVYTAAVEDGMTPEMLVSGAPVKRGSWMPHNFDGSTSHANVPLKVALAKSYNLAAVHLLEQVGIQAGAQMVRRFGITNPMAPSLPSALGASEVSLLEMTSAYSVFPNKGVRVQPHLIRKVYSRDSNLLEEWKNTTYKVTSEYVALTMVELMRGVTGPGGTAPGAQAGGHPLAGKTGTVNDHTDVWFIGYTPTYVTGVWMGNPEKKENLGRGMTGGVGALPFFNGFMSVFMKDKPKERFDEAPPIPPEIRTLIERNKREELEKLEKAQQAAIRSGATFTPATKAAGADVPITTGTSSDTSTGTPASNQDQSDPPPPASKSVIIQTPPRTNPDSPKNEERPESGTKRKGKKGDG
ncbi:MAG: hypothetical protein LC734_02135, partial [Acidobacteria bacterium]|nr:hypothetical protein [Acidobacteriota bacterium]